MRLRSPAALLIAAAFAAAILPLPRSFVEGTYSSSFFPVLQRGLTPLSNLAPIALFDVLLVGATAGAAVFVYRRIHEAGWRRGAVKALWGLAVAAAALYLIFLAVWGLNYRRVPLRQKFVHDSSRVTRERARALGDANAATVNQLYAEAHRAGGSLDALAAAFADTQRRLGAAYSIVPARPKQTLLGGWFHEVQVSGMTDPFFLETLIAPDLLDVERPFVIAHEWAHLAGYADESEASYVAWIVCTHGDLRARYSAALAMLGYVRPTRPLPIALDVGPRIDLFAIQRRYQDTSPVLRAAARKGYDTYLKANRVEEGVESYDVVVELILGGAVDAEGYPRRR